MHSSQLAPERGLCAWLPTVGVEKKLFEQPCRKQNVLFADRHQAPPVDHKIYVVCICCVRRTNTISLSHAPQTRVLVCPAAK